MTKYNKSSIFIPVLTQVFTKCIFWVCIVMIIINIEVLFMLMHFGVRHRMAYREKGTFLFCVGIRTANGTNVD